MRAEFERIYFSYNHQQPYGATADAIAARSLKNVALSYLMLLDDSEIITACENQSRTANNMTDVMAAFTQLVNSAVAQPQAMLALEDFYQRWQAESLVVNQWLSVQATCILPGTIARVKELQQHAAYDTKNPKKIRAVVSAFCNNNPINFHDLAAAGEGYRFLADEIIRLNQQNPQIAARLLTPLTKWKKYDSQRQTLMKGELQRILARPDLSPDVYEVVSKSLV